jgi:hypothetical protein
MADANEDANDGDEYDHSSQPNTPRDEEGAAAVLSKAYARPAPLDDDDDDDDDDDAHPLAPPPPHAWGLWCELGRCHERLGQRACAARSALAAVAEAQARLASAKQQQHARRSERAALWNRAAATRQAAVDAAVAVRAGEAAAAAVGRVRVDGGLYGGGSILGGSKSKGTSKGSQDDPAASQQKGGGEGEDSQSIADDGSLVSALTAPTVRAAAAGGAGGSFNGGSLGVGGESSGDPAASATDPLAELDAAASLAALAWEAAEARAWRADSQQEHQADAQGVRDALDHLAKVVGEDDNARWEKHTHTCTVSTPPPQEEGGGGKAHTHRCAHEKHVSTHTFNARMV